MASAAAPAASRIKGIGYFLLSHRKSREAMIDCGSLHDWNRQKRLDRAGRERAPMGALLRSHAYGRKKFGLNRAAGPRRRRRRIGDPAIGKRDGCFAGSDG